GMADLWHPSVRAKLCLSCHMGSAAEDKVISHAMYAAGHPPLMGFDLTTFSDQMPRHWLRVREMPEKTRKLLALASEEWETTQEVMLNGIITLREAMVHLSNQAYTAFQEKDWPDLTHFDCTACHSTLDEYSRRSAEQGQGRKLGQPLLQRWPRVLGMV